MSDPTKLAWMLAAGAFSLFVSLGKIDSLHRRERAFSYDYETDSDPTGNDSPLKGRAGSARPTA